ncbi:response regulator transcription factor [Paenibacillus alba]|uniref:Response regulator n=1 Tax=Paenibacillus alba TaxID=1197127 RepID=A0ABU6GF66_9BACL|nr:response regulator [Paenibacillus alba]MEC0231403.1 response regulator [Paenibacillus alba]
MRLLIVDDEPMIRSGLMKMAQQYTQSFQAIELAVNGVEALDRIQQMEPDLLITDIRMPKMDGLELCRILHESHPYLMKVVISGYNDFDYAQKCLSYGVKHYLLKPVTPPDIHEMLDQILRTQSQGLIPFSRLVAWVERLEESLWNLQTDEIADLMTEWKANCGHLPVQQLKYLLNEVLLMVSKSFQEKQRALIPELLDPLHAPTQADLFQSFECRMKAVIDNILFVRRGNYKDPMEEARVYIDTRLSVEVTLSEVADRVGITPTYFSTLFRKMTGETFISYRINKRMEKAKDLLSIPHKKTVDIASEVGYEDYPHFAKTFKKIFGMSPSEYRASMGIK